jgi:hypothetical protein
MALDFGAYVDADLVRFGVSGIGEDPGVLAPESILLLVVFWANDKVGCLADCKGSVGME